MSKYKKGDKVIISKYYKNSFDMPSQYESVNNEIVTIGLILNKAKNSYLIKSDSRNIGWCNDKCIIGIEGDSIAKSEPIEHIVQEGDTLLKIAEYYKTTYDKIAKDNNITNPNKLKVGEKLIIFS